MRNQPRIAAALILGATLGSFSCEGAPSKGSEIAQSRSARNPCVAGSPVLIDRPDFGRVRGATILGDSVLIVADGQSLNLHYFTLSGALIRTVGNRGGGPGEFLSIGVRVMTLADTAVIYDSRLSRFSLFSSDGRFERTVDPAGISYLDQAIALLPNGEYLAATAVNARAINRTKTVARFDTLEVQIRSLRDGKIRAVLGRVPDWYKLANMSRGFAIWEYPFAIRPTYAIAGDAILIASAESRVRRFNHQGIELSPLGPFGEPKSVTQEDMERWTEYQVALSVPGSREWTREVFAEIEPPTFMPAHGTAIVDGAGFVWIPEYRPQYDTSASLLRRVNLENGSSSVLSAKTGGRLIAASPKALAFVIKDSFDVETIRIYPLQCS